MMYARILLQEIGFLHLGLKYDARHGTVTIVVDQAKALPVHPITGTPSKLGLITEGHSSTLCITDTPVKSYDGP